METQTQSLRAERRVIRALKTAAGVAFTLSLLALAWDVAGRM